MSLATVFTKPGCGPCGATLRTFKSAGIPFTTRNLAEHPADAERLRLAGHRQAPVVEPTDPRLPAWSGFLPDRIKALGAPIPEWP